MESPKATHSLEFGVDLSFRKPGHEYEGKLDRRQPPEKKPDAVRRFKASEQNTSKREGNEKQGGGHCLPVWD